MNIITDQSLFSYIIVTDKNNLFSSVIVMYTATVVVFNIYNTKSTFLFFFIIHRLNSSVTLTDTILLFSLGVLPIYSYPQLRKI